MKKIDFNLNNIIIQAKKNIHNTKSINELNKIKNTYFGENNYFNKYLVEIKKSSLKDEFALNSIIDSSKKEIKRILSEKRKEIKRILSEKRKEIKITTLKSKLHLENLDVTLPGRYVEYGNLHPISNIINQIETFFCSRGFTSINGSEIEDEYHNFYSLNIPKNHPAWNIKDTFWIDNNRLLRTQTSSVQIRIMKKKKLPIKIISSGKVYRKDHDKTHTPMFHQIEGLFIDNNVSFKDLKSTVYCFLKNFFQKKIIIRFRPSYFPFTEPSAEVDIMDKKKNWLEVIGCGMVHPNILKNAEIDPNCYSGFAFGIGVERLAMLFYDISDIRLFFKNDLRFLKQFK